MGSGRIRQATLIFSPLLLLCYLFVGLVSLILLSAIFWFLAKGLYGGNFFLSLLHDDQLHQVLIFTYGQALASAALSIAIGLFLALAFTEFKMKGGETVTRVSLCAFSLPTVVVALLIMGAWGNQSWFVKSVGTLLGKDLFRPDLHRGWVGILFAHLFLNVAIPFQFFSNKLKSRSGVLEKVGRLFGLSRLGCLIQVTLPQLKREMVSSFWLVFLYCSMSFVIVLLLGGNPRFSTLEVSMYQALKVDLDWQQAARLALLQIISGSFIYFFILRKAVVPTYFRASQSAFLREKNSFFVPFVAWGLVLGLWGLPLGSLVGDVVRQKESLSILDSIYYSGFLACGVVPLSLLFALSFSYLRRHSSSGKKSAFLEWIASLPVFVSSLVFSVAWLQIFSTVLEGKNWARIGLVMIIQSVMVLPLLFRTLIEAYNEIPQAVIQMAHSLGASPWQCFRWVELSLLKRALIAAGGFSLAYSLGEIGSLLVFLPSEFEPIVLTIYRSLSTYRFERAYFSALALILLVFVFSMGHRLIPAQKEEKN